MNTENVNTVEKNNQKNTSQVKAIIGIIVVILIVVGIVFFVLGKKGNNDIGKGNDLKAYEIANLKEYDGTIPAFEFTISGAFQSKLTDAEIKKMNIKLYEFDANIDTGWNVVKNKYVGIKVKDLLEETKIYESTSHELTFEGDNRTSITYDLSKITEKMFIVFLRDDKNINDKQPVMLLNVGENYSYSIDQLVNIYVAHNIDNDVDFDENNAIE